MSDNATLKGEIWKALGKLAEAYYRLGVLDATHRTFHDFNVEAVPQMELVSDLLSSEYCDADHDATIKKHDVYDEIC